MPKPPSAWRRTSLLLAALSFVLLVAVFPRVRPYMFGGDAPEDGDAISDLREGEDLTEGSALAPPLGEAGAGDGITTRTLAMPIPSGYSVSEFDFPSLAMAPDGTAWLSYVSFDPGPPIRRAEVIAGNFDSLRMSRLGDTIRLTSYANGEWGEASDVTPNELNVWKPIVVSDSMGDLLVVWSQWFEGNWDLYSRWYSPASRGKGNATTGNLGRWSDVKRLTTGPGTDMNVVAVLDAGGRVWLAWQAWSGGQFDIKCMSAGPDRRFGKAFTISESEANDWSPSIAADSSGKVYVAWDTYAAGQYDVLLREVTGMDDPIGVAATARFEARPSIACDSADRVWIAYEEGDPQWGKDFANYFFPRERNPGANLYTNRTIRVKCWADGSLAEIAAPLHEALAEKMPLRQSVPWIGFDGSGRLWLTVRHHTRLDGKGEDWTSYVLCYNGEKWSQPEAVPHSRYLIGARGTYVTTRNGFFSVHASDGRSPYAKLRRVTLHAGEVVTGSSPKPFALAAASDPSLEERPSARRFARPSVHPDETAQVERAKDFSISVGPDRLRLVRGEFHRHTEYSLHSDYPIGSDGTSEDAWRYALDVASLDWMGTGDHVYDGNRFMWWRQLKEDELYDHPGSFAAIHCFERSRSYPEGHRNVILPDSKIWPLSSRLYPNPAAGETGVKDTDLLYAYLRHFKAIAAVHTSATRMGTAWRVHDPELEPLVEIYQGSRFNYEHAGAPRAALEPKMRGGIRPEGYVWNALAKGFRLGFESSSDHLSTHISYTMLYAKSLTREDVLDAMRKRHSYAATDNIIAMVRCGDYIMGDEFTVRASPRFEVHIEGTAEIERLSIISNGEYVYTQSPGRTVVDLIYTDDKLRVGETRYYYVRVEQVDGNIAWTSPMWVTLGTP